MKKNYKLLISYDGGRYHGWEKKKNVETVQGKLEEVLKKMCRSIDKEDCGKTPEKKEEIKIIGAGRTDAGVHARGMVANVHLETKKSPEEIREYMNRYIPDDIAVEEVREASPRFHARYNATGKRYVYTCYVGEAKPVFQRRYVTVLKGCPNVDKMREAAAYLEGRHDFKSFCGNARMKKSTVREVDEIEIIQEGNFIYFSFHGTGFLQNMVRIMTGTLLEVGYGRKMPEEMKKILAAGQRPMAGPTAPAVGLCLMGVDY